MSEVVTYGVFQHSSGVAGGFVVRRMYNGWCPAPYSKVEPVHEFATDDAAQAEADRLNGRVV